ncbi:MAG: DNA mismatch repair endonuclease MutL [Clostridiales bacterium]|nr:DNA mismatch repair endonuclease MutL [Clostridiales bacterium]
MPDIQILSPLLANQIAAGEVVERPASVVKELVENCIDAGASKISVTIEGGGFESIAVTDDGAGIPAAQCRTAFLRHATSKIRETEDLQNIQTMGFRGEALASIASVSAVELYTRTKDESTGTYLLIEAGEMKAQNEIAHPGGTKIVVSNLFLNVPARRKFLKAAHTEAGYVGDVVARAILSHPEIAFRYTANGRTVYESFGDNNLLHAIHQVYGPGFAAQLLPVEMDNGYMQVSGYIGKSELTRPNRAYQTIFVNDRVIRSQRLSQALQRAYATRVMAGRYPVAILNIRISGREIDVNVHPDKTEIRFSDEARVDNTLCAAVSAALQNSAVPVGAIESPGRHSICPPEPIAPSPQRSDLLAQAMRMRDSSKGGKLIFRESANSYASFRALPSQAGKTPLYAVPNAPVAPVKPPPAPPRPKPLPIDDCRLLGCAFSTYWIAEQGDALLLIDQHAAHERILYEKLRNKEISFGSQVLMFPQELTLLPDEMRALREHAALLCKCGLEWEEMGETCINISAFPVLSGRVLPEIFLHDILDGASAADLQYEKLVQTACKHAVKAGDALTEQEIRTLLRTLESEDIPLTCPHGRPVITTLHRRDIEKMFKRIV